MNMKTGIKEIDEIYNKVLLLSKIENLLFYDKQGFVFFFYVKLRSF